MGRVINSCIFFIVLLLLILASCNENDLEDGDLNVKSPVVYSDEVSLITESSVLCVGTILSDGGAPIKFCGVCWDTIPNFTFSQNKTTDSLIAGRFVSKLNGLIPGTTYYFRAYAINCVDTAFSEERAFTTLGKPSIPVDKEKSDTITFHGTCDVTMVNSSGFLIVAGNKKVMVDAIINDFMYLKNNGPVVNETIISSVPPFDNIDLILVTHHHSDHFDPKYVARFLENHTETHFAAPSNCIIDLMMNPNYYTFSDRVHEIILSPSEFVYDTINAIPVTLIYTLGHEVHYSYYFNVNGVRCFHAGDINTDADSGDIMNYSLLIKAMRNLKIDIDFDFSKKSTGNLVKAKLPEYFIPFHYDPNVANMGMDVLEGVTRVHFSSYIQKKTLIF